MRKDRVSIIRNMVHEDDKIKGGLGDNASLSSFCYSQIVAGIAVEMEHTEDAQVALEITLDHLTEDPQYYSSVIPFNEVKEALQEVLRKVKNPVIEEMMSSGNMGGFAQTANAVGQPGGGFLKQDSSTPVKLPKPNRSKKSKGIKKHS